MARQSGFTLIELLCSLSIVSILTLNSVQIFSILRQRVYDTARDKLIHDTKTSMEASRSAYDKGTGDWFWVLSDSTGSLRGWHMSSTGGEVLNGDAILPGLRVNPDSRMNASWNSWCNQANMPWCDSSARCCITESVTAYHCKGRTVKMIFTWNNGETDDFEWNNMGC